jgi:hypothetical protein
MHGCPDYDAPGLGSIIVMCITRAAALDLCRLDVSQSREARDSVRQSRACTPLVALGHEPLEANGARFRLFPPVVRRRADT